MYRPLLRQAAGHAGHARAVAVGGGDGGAARDACGWADPPAPCRVQSRLSCNPPPPGTPKPPPTISNLGTAQRQPNRRARIIAGLISFAASQHHTQPPSSQNPSPTPSVQSHPTALRRLLFEGALETMFAASLLDETRPGRLQLGLSLARGSLGRGRIPLHRTTQ